MFLSVLNFEIQPKRSWVHKRLGIICSKIGSGATPKGGQASYKDEGIALIRSMNVHDLFFKYNNLAFIDEKQASLLDNVTVKENDILINITGASVTRACIVPSNVLPARVNQHVSILRIKPNEAISHFINYLLVSKTYRDELLNMGEKAGTTRQALTKVQLEKFNIYLPSLEEQQQIVSKLDALSEKCKKLEKNYQQTIDDCDELKKAILAKAFNGEL